MRISSSVTVPAPRERVDVHLVDLSRYVEWMPLVHSVERVGRPQGTAWNVELRARVGPFARSKRLRMELVSDRTEGDLRTVVFERRETGNIRHSMWRMAVRSVAMGDATEVTVDLEYGGSLWTAGVLDRVLAAQIDEGKRRLVALVSRPTH